MNFKTGDIIETWDGDLGLVLEVQEDLSKIENEDGISMSPWCETGIRALVTSAYTYITPILYDCTVMFLYADTVKLRLRRHDT